MTLHDKNIARIEEVNNTVTPDEHAELPPDLEKERMKLRAESEARIQSGWWHDYEGDSP